MNILGNILWLIFGGLVIALMYVIAGIFLCVTIIGIPFGFQAFKLGAFALLPFGKTTVISRPGDCNGCLYSLMNILWIIFGGLWISIAHFVLGLLLFITIIGIPFGFQHFKLMTIALTPFGRTIVHSSDLSDLNAR